MSVLVQYLKFLKSSPGENEKKEKKAELPGYAPSVAGAMDNDKKDEDKLTSSITDHGLTAQETPKNINTASAEPVAMRSSSSAAVPAFTQPVANPGRGYNTGVPRPQTQQQPTKIPRVLESIPMANSVTDPRSGTLLDKQSAAAPNSVQVDPIAATGKTVGSKVLADSAKSTAISTLSMSGLAKGLLGSSLGVVSTGLGLQGAEDRWNKGQKRQAIVQGAGAIAGGLSTPLMASGLFIPAGAVLKGVDIGASAALANSDAKLQNREVLQQRRNFLKSQPAGGGIPNIVPPFSVQPVQPTQPAQPVAPMQKQGSLGYSRNTGISDVEGEIYVNGSDVELLSKLGFEYSCEEYLGLEKTSEVLDVYSYIEKVAGVPKEVAKLIDAGQAFSGEYLKDMGYSVPKGYEVKGDLVSPVEKPEQSFQQDEKEKKGSPEKTANDQHKLEAVVIKGNPKYLNNPHADKFYQNVANHLKGHGYNVSFDNGEPYTSPKAADLWVGHSRGVDRLRFAPKHTKTIALGDVGGINHSKDKALSKDGPIPDKWHFTLSDDMKSKIDNVIGKTKTAAVDPAQTILITGHSGSEKTANKENVVYHGSGVDGLTELAPRASRVIGGNSAVFATPDRDEALSFLAPWRDNDFEHGSVNGQYYMREKYPDAFEKKFKNKSGTIYHLPIDGFEQDSRLTKFERINKNKVKPLKAEKIENILEALQNSKFKLLKHKELAPWEKIANEKTASKLRSNVNITKHDDPSGLTEYIASIGDKKIGNMLVADSKYKGKVVAHSLIDPEFRGMGLGKKLYGEVMRRQPEGVLHSGPVMSEDAQRVWASLNKNKGYEIAGEAPELMGRINEKALNIPNKVKKLHPAVSAVEAKGSIFDRIKKLMGIAKRAEHEKEAAEAIASPGSSTTATGSWHRSEDSLVNPKGKVMNNTPNSKPMAESPYLDISGDVALNTAETLVQRLAKKFNPLNKNKLNIGLRNGYLANKYLTRASKAVPAIGATLGASEAHNRWQQEDTTGTAIKGLGVAGDIAQMSPDPRAKVIGLGASWGSTAANAARDISRYNNRPVEFRNTPPSIPQPSAPQSVPIQQPLQLLAKQSAADHPVNSSNIKAVGYDKPNRTLEIAFHSGGEYKYADVPKSLFDRIKKVKSPGKFFHKHVQKKALPYEKVEKEAEYKWHKSKDLHRDVTNGRHYPFSFLTGEAKELVDAVKNRDMTNFKEEIGDTTYAAQMLAAQATGLNHPVYADLSKFHKREKTWKSIFNEKGGTYHPKHMEGGSNFAKPSKVIKALASAGIKINQREAERLANKHTGGKMEKEAGFRIPKGKIPLNHPELLPGMAEHIAKQPFNRAENAFAQGRMSKALRDSILSGRRAEEVKPAFEKMKEYIKNL